MVVRVYLAVRPVSAPPPPPIFLWMDLGERRVAAAGPAGGADGAENAKFRLHD